MRVQRLSPEAARAFTHVPGVDVDRARVVVVPLLTPGVVAITIGRFVLVRRGRDHDVGLMAHELVHVQQWREHGAIGFLGRYLGEYLRARLRGQPHWAAYAAIPYEVEARARSGS